MQNLDGSRCETGKPSAKKNEPEHFCKHDMNKQSDFS